VKAVQRDGYASSLAAALQVLLDERGIGARIRQLWVLPRWAEAVGPGIAEHTRPITVRKGTLVVNVDSSGWLTQLTMLQKDIVDRINQQAGATPIKNVRFRLGETSGGPERTKPAETAPKPLQEELEASRAQWVQARCLTVDDPKLRRCMERLLTRDQMDRQRRQRVQETETVKERSR